MRRILPGLIVGLIFGAGLALSDMINPARVLAFLDPLGGWDPTLAFVMGGALLPSALGYLVVRRLPRPVLAESFCIPENRVLDRQLLAGAALFGAGWGLAGFCPGPAVAGLVFGLWQPWLFVAAMLAGMAIHRMTIALAASRPAAVRP
ncbi:MAG: DUF6691 family protein [Allosphingosinicella sp.]